MAKVGALFIITLLFLFVGAYLQKNPQWLQPYRLRLNQNQLMPSTFSSIPHPTINPVNKDWQRFSEPGEYSLSYPKEWQLQTDVPGCGPVWFAPETKKVWFTICGPYQDHSLTTLADSSITSDAPLIMREPATVSGKQALRQELRLENGRNTQIFIDSPRGAFAVYFTHLLSESSVDYEGSFNQILSTFAIR